jgi:hypothetical protein
MKGRDYIASIKQQPKQPDSLLDLTPLHSIDESVIDHKMNE